MSCFVVCSVQSLLSCFVVCSVQSLLSCFVVCSVQSVLLWRWCCCSFQEGIGYTILPSLRSLLSVYPLYPGFASYREYRILLLLYSTNSTLYSTNIVFYYWQTSSLPSHFFLLSNESESQYSAKTSTRGQIPRPTSRPLAVKRCPPFGHFLRRRPGNQELQ